MGQRVNKSSKLKSIDEGKVNTKKVRLIKPETKWSIHGQVEVGVQPNEGPNSRLLQKTEMSCE